MRTAGELFVCGFDGLTMNEEIKFLIREKHIAGVILFRHNIASREQLKALTNALQQEAKDAGYTKPLLITVDEECGTVSRLNGLITPFPGAMLLGATNDEELVEKVYGALANELLELGINWNLAPVVDVQNNRSNPVIGVRSFGEDAKQVGRFGVRALTGLQRGGVIATLKHFPGHGDTAVDSHLSLPVIPHDEKRLHEIELVPFKEGIRAQVDCIMAAHIHFPQIDDSQLPASISEKVMTGLLREQLEFDGAIITDCLEMKAISDSIGTEQACVKAVQAGVNFLLVSHTFEKQIASIEAVERGIAEGEISAQQLAIAFARIDKVVERVGQVQTQPIDATAVANQAFEQGVTVWQQHAIEFSASLPIFMLGTDVHTIAEDAVSAASIVKRALAGREVQWLTFEECRSAKQPFIVITQNAADDAKQIEQLQQLEQSAKQFAVIATKKPYDAALTSRMTICTFEPSKQALQVAFAILLNNQKAQGIMPVSI